MFKLIEPANQIVKQKKKQLEERQSTLVRPTALGPSGGKIAFVNDRNYDEYCILVYDFFKLNAEQIRGAGQVRGYIERGEGKE